MCHSIRPHVIYFFNQSFFFGGSRNRSIHYQRNVFSSYNKSVYFYYANVSKMIIDLLVFLFLCHIISIFQSELWLPYFLLFIFCKNFLQNWCFLQTKNKKKQKKISNIYNHISSPKLQKKIFFKNIFYCKIGELV